MPPAATGCPRVPLHVLEVVGNAILGGMESWVERFIERFTERFIERMPRKRFRFTALRPADRLAARPTAFGERDAASEVSAAILTDA